MANGLLTGCVTRYSMTTMLSEMRKHMKNIVITFIRDEQGQDLIEYALLAALVTLASYMAVDALGDTVSGKYADYAPSVAAAS
jgi:Flp pilus assembly pilin Flp